MITQINHLGIAVTKLAEHIPFYRDILKLEFQGYEEIPDQKVRTAIFKVGEVKIELLEPTSTESPIAKFIEKRGEGLHHIAYQSNDIEGEIKQFAAEKIQLIDMQPKEGAHGSLIAFVHPKSSGKVLTEICQLKDR
jgi:methylmalonyl-CoA/ethylmalonyl-CoA epimerase